MSKNLSRYLHFLTLWLEAMVKFIFKFSSIHSLNPEKVFLPEIRDLFLSQNPKEFCLYSSPVDAFPVASWFTVLLLMQNPVDHFIHPAFVFLLIKFATFAYGLLLYISLSK